MLTESQGARLIEQLAERFRQLHHQVLKYRRPHFRNDESMNPHLTEPLDHVKFQHDTLRDTWTVLKSRLSENHYVIRVNNRADRNAKSAHKTQELLNAASHIVEERLGYTLQEALVDGQAVDCYGVIHWRMMDTIWPDMPDYEYLDDEPTGPESKRFRKTDDDRYKETDDSLQKRTREERARAGFPYYLDVLDPTTVFFRTDMTNNIGTAAHIREVGYLDYADELGEGMTPKQILIDNARKLRVVEKTAPSDDSISGPDFDKVTVATLWTKTEWMEYISETGISQEEKTEADATAWTFVKRGTHDFGRPPFEIVTADTFNEADPAFRYMPAMEGVYRMKPNADRMVAIVSGLAERHAVPDTWWQQAANSIPSIDAAGQAAVLGTDAASAGTMPPGYELKIAAIQINQAMIEMTQRMSELLDKSVPNTGTAELSATTQPWTARLAMQQANVYPKVLLGRQARGLQNAWRSILRSMAKLDGGVWAYRLDDDGNETDELIGIEPEDIVTLNLTVAIDAVSAPEQITLVEHGANMLERRLITKLSFGRDYKSDPNPSKYVEELEAEEVVERFLKPGLIAQAVAEIWGPQVVVGPDGNLMGMGGQPVDPNQFVADNGWQQPQPQGGMSQGQQGAGLGPLVDQPPPGVMPQPPMPGMGPV